MPICCTDVDTLLQTYLDDELAEGESREFEAHLGVCGTCRGRTASAARFRDVIRDKLQPPRAPEDLRERVALALDREEWRMRRSRRGWVLPGAATVAAAAAMLLFIVTSLPISGSASPVADDAVLQHMRRQAIEVQGAAVSPWERTQSSGEMRMPQFRGVRAKVKGARISELRGRPALQIFYKVMHGQRPYEVALQVFDAQDVDFGSGFPGSELRVANNRELWVGELRGYTVVAHRDAEGTGYMFTSADYPAEDLASLVAEADLPPPLP
ncbi:anti-sigma factor family protein [Haliangium ochraceum]|uniref:Putative transmembrane anti-sigma factor n=1 Tax=Haliangium ochraceum (strain DSM 14365 / JCM 11303 / SMP-2) TaxID=502025 RepID=D0LYF9_HALO1|nr:zf-HC2 domain-containing protein [Haliangium ochraceum]ACY17825.1 putative transmembrane anti-sigma factor [Haliangium ochraceum DSM 14365]